MKLQYVRIISGKKCRGGDKLDPVTYMLFSAWSIFFIAFRVFSE